MGKTSIEWTDRELGPEMTAEGWLSAGLGGSLMWCHPPSFRTVNVEARERREGDAGFGSDDGAPEDEGWMVCVCVRDEGGCPTSDFKTRWSRSFGDAAREARAIRTAILAERADVATADQGELFEDVQ